MEADLQKIIQSTQELSDDVIKLMMYQLVRSLHFLHSAGIAHRDVKPKNILVNSDLTLKLCDFGLARPVGSQFRKRHDELT